MLEARDEQVKGTRIRSSPLPGRLMRSLLLSAALGLPLCACMTRISTTLPVSECPSLLPSSVTAPTPGAPIPTKRTVGALAAFGDAQTGQLDKANVDKAAILAFEARCKARDAELIKSVTKKPWWQIF